MIEADDSAARLRAEMLERWEDAACGWARRADRIRAHGMPVTAWLIDHLELQPGQRVLELGAGAGDTGFMAAELVAPSGSLISSDASDGMVEAARARAAALEITNVEFRRLELEWIDLPTASVDAIVCRWALMLSLDPAAALHECRRVLRPSGRLALAVWDDPAANPWGTITSGTLFRLGLGEPPERDGPGMFALASPKRLAAMMEAAGFVEVVVEPVAIERIYGSSEEYIEETLDLSILFARSFARLGEADQVRVRGEIAAALTPFVDHGRVRIPGRALCSVGFA